MPSGPGLFVNEYGDFVSDACGNEEHTRCHDKTCGCECHEAYDLIESAKLAKEKENE